jgi:hypothetical protein
MRAQDALLKAGTVTKELNTAHTSGPYDSIRNCVRELDTRIRTVAAELDQFQVSQMTEGADASAAQNLCLNARFLVQM